MILIIDDNAENIFSLKKILELHNLEVDTASSGEEGLRKILKATYALIILDVQMPGMDGFEVAEAISGYSKAKDTPIIFLSAVSIDKKFITRGYASGALDYITKPVDPDILMLKVKTFLRLYEQTRILNETQKALREELEFKDEFISIASHELKTPLTSIKAYLQLLQRSLESSEDKTVLNYLQRTQIQIEKLHHLITDLLDISKIESGKLKFNKKTFPFRLLLRSVIETMEQTHPGCVIHVKGNSDVQVYGDNERIEQVLINYLTNAIKYSPDCNEVEIETEMTDDKELQVNIKDRGIGISKEQQVNIFQKFYRAEDSANRFQGLGIGLYICAEIIKRHNGKYGVISEPGKGSVFYFSIPIVAPAAPQTHDLVNHNING